MEKPAVPQGAQVVVKPVGSRCNMNCEYCFYLEKDKLFSRKSIMEQDVLETFIKNYIDSQFGPEIEFVWSGGEPTLRGVDFYKKAVLYQAKHNKDVVIKNLFQTNGLIIDDSWCELFNMHDFTVDLSIDGPKEIHDRYRKDANGGGTFDKVYRTMKLLQQREVKYRILASVTDSASRYPLEIYNFFKSDGVEHINFTPIVERGAIGIEKTRGQAFSSSSGGGKVTGWSVDPIKYGKFLISVYSEWVKHDVGKITVEAFDGALAQWVGGSSRMCAHARQCGRSLAVESDGTVYACDHNVYPEYELGNVCGELLIDMSHKLLAGGFGVNKELKLSFNCQQCEHLKLCRGGCPNGRFTYNKTHYLCEGYRLFFSHIPKYLEAMAKLVRSGRISLH